jgi:hypothetical protein
MNETEIKDLLRIEWKGTLVPQRWFSRAEVIELLKKVMEKPQ